MAKPTGLSGSDAVALAHTTRDGVVESIHHGIVAVVGPEGSAVLERGNTEIPVFPRSTLKPFQAMAVLATGVELTDLEVALTTASHCGSSEHRRAIQGFLERFGFGEEDLRCPADWPLGSAERAQLLAEEGQPRRLAMNCSGKHAGFLAACAHSGWDPEAYLERDHPLQAAIAEEITKWTGEAIAFSSTDGCGAPLHQVSIRGLAQGISALCKSEEPPATRFLDAVAAHAWALDGEGRANTVTIERLGGIAKIGAEGLVVIGLRSGASVAVKILDGAMRATTPVALAALAEVGAIEAGVAHELAALTAEDILGGERVVGSLQVRL